MIKRIEAKVLLVSVLFLVISSFLFEVSGQFVISIKPTYKLEKLVLEDKLYVSSDFDTLTFSTFKFYLTNVKIHFADGTIVSERGSCHLVDLEHPESLDVVLPKFPTKEISYLEFIVGVDSSTNVSGALSGDLDPIKGMYWAWNTGYIQLKLIGKSKKRLKDFEFHIGGYLSPFSTMRKVLLPFGYSSSKAVLQVHLDLWLDRLNLSTMADVVVPGKSASEMADLYSKMFTLVPQSGNGK